MHCGTEPQTSKPITEAHTQSSPGKNKHIKQELQENHPVPLSSPPSPMLPIEEIQRDEGRGQALYHVSTPAFESVGPTATAYPDSMSGQEPLLINTTEDMLSPDGAFTPLGATGIPTLWSEQGTIKEEISKLFTEDLLLTQSSTGTPAVTDSTDVSTSVPSSEPPTALTATPAQGNTSLMPMLTAKAVQTDPPLPATATETDTLLAGGDSTSAQTRGPTPADEAQNHETQPTPSAEPTNAQMRPNPSPSQPSERPTRLNTHTDITQTLTTDNPDDNIPEDNNDTNLCSGQPISGLTTLRNGTVVVFRGHYFWVLDANRSPGPALGITAVWGIPSPIDTVFTRCQCEGKTYFIKGKTFWRFENNVMDQGYPKSLSEGFGKLAGKITAALSVPATMNRRDSVYFFKTGGLVQKYTYRQASACKTGVSNRVYLVRNRFTRQAASTDNGLGKEINIKLKWRGFPTLVTSAVSIPRPRQSGGYDYHIFSRTKYYKIRLVDDQPTLATPLTIPSQQNSAKNWFNCP